MVIRKITGTFIIILITLYSCVPIPLSIKPEMYPPIEASLAHINQKIAGHFNVIGVPDNFDAVQYRAAVEEVCFPIPSCKSQAEGIFNSFGIKAKKVDGMFTVMLCDKNLRQKAMEDFSCNNLRVEVRSWKAEGETACEFEADWQDVVEEYCE